MSPRTPAPINQPATLQTQQDDALPEIAGPRWEWVLDARGISVSVILGVLAYFGQFLTQEVPDWAWLGAGAFLVLLWLLVPSVVYLWRGVKAVRARYRQYPIARDYGRHTGRELEQAHERVNKILPYVSVFDVKHVVYEQTSQGTQEVYIVVAKAEEVDLQVGDNLRVIDESDDRPMGVFRVQREREHDYFAVEVEIDAMWLGSIHQDGRREQYPPMNAVARLIQRSS